MVLLNKIFILLILLSGVKAEEIKLFYTQIISESNFYKYKNNPSCMFELDRTTLKFKNNPKIELGDVNIKDLRVSYYCKQFYDNNKLKKSELFETTPYVPIHNNVNKPKDFKELKLLKRFIYNNQEQVSIEYDYVTKTQIKYYYTNNTIEVHRYKNDILKSIERKYYASDLLTKGKIYLMEGTLEEASLLLKNKVLYSDKKKIVEYYVYTYGKGVKTCIYDESGRFLSANNTFKEWIITEDKNGRKYPKIKEETCEKLDFKPKDKYMLDDKNIFLISSTPIPSSIKVNKNPTPTLKR